MLPKYWSPLHIQLLILGIHLVTGSEFNAQTAFQITFPEVSSNVLKVDLHSIWMYLYLEWQEFSSKCRIDVEER